ncbi:MAG: 23S rRNA (guanosine(2251)-2'-O)-methyltransferase RlmB [Cyclobacteriaceae bacterium]
MKTFKKAPPVKENMIYGIRSVMEALDAGQHLEKVFLQKGLKGELMKECQSMIRESDTPVSSVPIEKLNRFTRKNHQGVVAFISPVKYYDLHNLLSQDFENGKVPFFLLLDRVTDVRNFGAIARSAESFGVTGIVIPAKNAAQINADAVKASAGALTKIPVCRVNDLDKSAQYLKLSGCALVACTEKGSNDMSDAPLSGPIALIMGSEEDGISASLIKQADYDISIPMKGEIASLNVSAAASIFMYEVMMTRN